MIKRLLPTLLLLTVGTLSYGAQQTVNVGSAANDGTGDTGRIAFQKVNTNFTELYGLMVGTTAFSDVIISSTLVLPAGAAPTAPSIATAGDFLLGINGTLTGGPFTGQWGPIRIYITTNNFTHTGGATPALSIEHHFSGAGVVGNMWGLKAGAYMDGTTGNLGAGISSNYVGGTLESKAVANDGGTGTGVNSHGALFGQDTVVQLLSGGTFWHNVIGAEQDIEIDTGASADNLYGYLVYLNANHAVNGAFQTAGYALAATTNADPRFKQGISFGTYDGFWPLDATGTMIGTYHHAGAVGSAGTTTNGVDFSNVTFTGNAFASNGFSVDGSGNILAASITTGVSSARMQGGLPFLLAGGAASNMGNNGALTAITAIPATLPDAYVFAAPGSIGNATATSVTITGTAGQFACTCTGLVVGQYMTLSGTYGGTGSITGYADPTIYYVSATNGTGTFTLQTSVHTAIVTTAGTPTGITYAAGGGWFYAVGSSTTAFTLYNNLYTTGIPAIPGSPTAFSTTGVGGFTQSTGFLIPSVATTLSAGSLSVSGEIDIEDALLFLSSATTKTTQIQWQGVSTDTQAYTTSSTGTNAVKINPVGITSKAVSSFNNWVATNNTVTSTQGFSIDTTSDQRLQIVMELNTAATDYMILKRYSLSQH